MARKIQSRLSQNKINTETTSSDYSGLLGFFERLLRGYKTLFHIALIMPLYLAGAALVGVALIPGVHLVKLAAEWSSSMSSYTQAYVIGASLFMAYMLYGFSMVILLPTFNAVLGIRLKEWRGPYYSLPAIAWYIHNGATYLLRYTFLELITPTPMNLLFYRLMGMKIGRGTVINTTHISDPSLLTLGRKVTIGGSVVIVGHYGQSGYLVLAPVVVEDEVTIGLRATIMGGVHIGKGAKILPHSAVMPKTIIPAGETWGGVPAQKINISKLKSIKKSA
jgi:hypothetical protein